MYVKHPAYCYHIKLRIQIFKAYNFSSGLHPRKETIIIGNAQMEYKEVRRLLHSIRIMLKRGNKKHIQKSYNIIIFLEHNLNFYQSCLYV